MRARICNLLWWASAYAFPILVLYYGFKIHGFHFIRVLLGF